MHALVHPGSRLPSRNGHSRLRGLWLLGWALFGLVAAPAAFAAPVFLTDDNASVRIDPMAPSAVQAWQVEGILHLREQGFYYRVGDAGPESPFSSLALDRTVVSDVDGDGADDTLFAALSHDRFEVELRWSLDGGPFGTPLTGASGDLVLQLTLQNTSDAPLDLHLFQWSDVDLLNTPGDDLVMGSGAAGIQAVGVEDALGVAAYEAVFTPASDLFQAALFGEVLPSLQDGGPTTLSGAEEAGGPFGADITWAAQWDAWLPAGGSFQLSQDQQVRIAPVPEPSRAALFTLGLTGLARLGARRR